MIAAWMVYTMLVGGLLYAAARAAEFVCRALRAPTRFVWLVAICAAIGLSANALRQRGPAVPPAPTRSVLLGGAASANASPSSAQRSAAAAAPRWRGMLASLRSELDASHIAGFTMIDRPLSIAAWLAGLVGVAYLLVALARMRRLALGLDARELDGYRVLVSDDIGPALVGIARPDIVVPRWVLALDAADRRDILSHEREHARAGDPALAACGALLLALEPWSLALWAMFARLRLAIEADCDARVLRSHADARRYGSLLLTVYERTIGGHVPRLAFVERRSHLEERIRRVATRGPALRSARTAVATLGSITLAAAACEATAPSKAARTPATKSSVSVVGVEPACIRDGPDRPSMTDLMARVRGRHPEVFGPRAPNHLVLGLLLDENCAITRDTVLSFPASDSEAGRLMAATFGDTAGFTTYGMGYFPSPKFAGPLTVVFAVKPSQLWRERLSRTECGFGVRSDDHCGIQGPLVIRMVDSVRALIAVRRFRAPNQPAENLFLVTLARPYPALSSRSLVHGVVMYQSGAVYVEDFGATQPLWLFAPSSSNGLATLKQKRDVQVFTDLVGVAHYNAGWLTLEQIDRLTPAKTCDGPKGACWEVDGHQIEFPG